MDDWTHSEDGLNAKLKSLSEIADLQKEKVNALKQNYDQLIKDGLDPTSNEASKLRTELNNEEAALAKTTKEINDNTKALEDLGKETDDVEKKTKGLDSIVDGVKSTFDGWKSKVNDVKENHKTLTKSLEMMGSAAKTAAKIGVASIAAIGGAAVKAGKEIWDMANQTAEAGDEIDKESQKLGLSAESYQKLSYAMERSGGSVDAFKKGTINISKELENVKNGVDGAGDTFTNLGVKMQNADGSMRSTEDVLLDSVDALSKIKDETARNAAANELFGKSYTELAPLLNQGSEGIKGLMNEAEEYGMVMSDDAVKAGATFEDSLKRMQETMNGVKNNLMGSLLPGLTDVMDGISDLIAGKDGAEEKITKGVTNLIENVRNLIPKAKEFLSPIFKALIKELPGMFNSLLQLVIELLPEIGAAITEALPDLVETLVRATPEILKAIGTIFKEVMKALWEIIKVLGKVGLDMLKGLFSGLLDPQKIWEACKKLFNDIVGGLKKLFGINSPSKVMENMIGKNLALGIGEGFENNIGAVNQEISDAMKFDDARFNVSATYSGNGIAGAGNTVVVNQYNTYSQAHSRYEIYKSKQQTAAAVRLAMAGA